MNKSTEKSQCDWDSVCSRCGRCCYEKIDFDGRIYYTTIPCQFLDTQTKLCRVYAERDRQNPGCVRLTEATLAKGFLPADCPYVAEVTDYPAPVMPEDND
jgi:uncharacterized cysteine cluster protein YcgN (CxxCxxCC family)